MMRLRSLAEASVLLAVACADTALAGETPSTNLVVNPSFEADHDGDGFPDGWFAAGGKTHPANWHCQKAKGKACLAAEAHSGRGSLLYVSPKPYDWRSEETPAPWDFAAWQEARKRPETRFYYSAPVVSEEFTVEYPKVYEVSAWVKAENVAGLHIKFIGVSPKGSPHWFPPALLTPEGLTGKSGSWDWQLWRKTVVANRGGSWKGRIEVWMRENVTDGRFWIDDVMVREVDHGGQGIQPMPQGAVAVSFPPATTRRPAVEPDRAPQVEERDDRLVIRFGNGATVTFGKTDAAGGVGIGKVIIHGIPIRHVTPIQHGTLVRRPTPPIRPLIETAVGGRYAQCRYADYEIEGRAVVVSTHLIEHETAERDKLDWVLEPVELDVHERRYAGFRYSYRFESRTNVASGIWDRATWELGGEAHNLRVKGSGALRTPLLRREMGFEGRPSIPFLCTPCFDFQAEENAGLLLLYLDRIGHVETWLEKRSGDTALCHLARHYFPAALRVQTVPRCVVFSPHGALEPLQMEDEHTWALDTIEARYRSQIGLEEQPLLPTVRLHPHSAEGGKFAAYIKHLPNVRRLGYEVVMLNPIWESLNREGEPTPGTCSITGLDVAEALGGEPGLKRLADAVHAQGMQLITWAPTGLNRQDSALLRDHPDWICRRPDGSPTTYGGPGAYEPGRALTYVFLGGGYRDYSLTRYRHFRRTIGLDGFWQDSFHALRQLHFREPGLLASNLEPGAKRQVQLQQMGYRVLNIEGFGPFGNDSTSPKLLAVGGRQDYKTSRYYYLALGPDTYYRSIANKAMPILPYHDSKHPYWGNRSVATNPLLREEIRRANKDYAVVRAKMKRRFLIPSKTNPWREVGVLWRAEGSSEELLFAYASFQWQTGRGRPVMDVTAGAPVATSQGLLTTAARHTYLYRSP